MKKIFSAILILSLVFVLLPASVSAEALDVYVSSTGSDENSGTQDSPYATLGKAVEGVADGGTIHVVGTVAVSNLKCTKRGYSITITGGTLDMSGTAYLILGDAVTFRDITLTRSTDDGKQVRIYANGYKMVMDTGITTSGNVELFGGGYYAKVASTDLTVLSGTYRAIYGGGIAASDSTLGTSQVNGDVKLYVGGTTNANADHTDSDINTGSIVCGGGRYAPVAGQVNLTFTGSAKASYVFGGGYGANATVAGGVHTVVSGNVKAMDVTGGGYCCGENGGVDLVITGGELEQVFGGTQGASEIGNVTVTILGGTITRRVYGGCYNDYDLSGWASSYGVQGDIRLMIGGDANITLSSSESDTSIYACSRHASDVDTKTTELIFLDETAYNAYQDKLGAQDSTMAWIMGDVAAADATHYYTFKASGATLTGTCTYHTDEEAIQATLCLDSAASLQYTGKAVTPAVVTVSDNWVLGMPEIQYTNNIKESTSEEYATASITVDGVTASLDFYIETVYFRSISLGESIAINFKATRSFLETRDLQKVEFYMDGNLAHTITGIPAGSEDRVSFTFDQLTPAQMGKEVTAKFCFADGTYDERSTSVEAYALSMLGKSEDAKLKTLLVDMLGYGAASQTYVGDTGTLVSAGDYASLGTTAEPVLVNDLALGGAPATELVTWRGVGLNLMDSVTVRFKFRADSTEGLTLKVTCGGNTWEITEFQTASGGYYVFFSGLNPAQLREKMEAVLYDANGTQVSKTLTYSVVSYAYAVDKESAASANLKSLTTALMRYGDAAADWVGDEYAVSVTIAGKTEYFETLEAAVERANAADTAAQIVVFKSVSLSTAMEINNNVTIVNAPGTEITISRGGLAANMFTVNKDASLTLGTNDTAETGALILDGASTDAIAFRTVKVNSGASFTLGKNAALRNSNSTVAGGALYVAGTAELYGTICDNKSQATGAGLYVVSGATVNSSGATFSGNDSTANTQNGGAVYVAGTFIDNDSTYTGNQAKNGGAIFLGASTAKVELTGTDAAKALFSGNGAKTANGGAIFVNGGTLTVSGYTFEDNTGTTYTDSAIYIASGSATVENAVFRGSSAQKIYVSSALTFQNLTDAQIVELKAAATITLSGDAGANVQLKPYSYTDDTVVVTGEGVDFTAITVTPVGDGSCWIIDEYGVLQNYPVASIGTTQYNTLTEAVEAANSAEAATEIVVLRDVSLVTAIEIQKDVTFVNASGETITISRGDLTADMFTVSEGGSLTLGTNNADETGKLILDGASEAAIAYRTVTVAANATFTLGENAVLQNANSTQPGGALHVTGTAYLYGAISDNKSGNTGAGLYVASGATVNSSGATFSGNDAATSKKNGGAVYVAGTFIDTNSTYTGNQAKNGGAIFLGASTAKVELTGTDATALFSGNTATGDTGSRGGAIFVNGGTLTVNGYTFAGNTATKYADSAIHVERNNATVENAVFQGTSAQKIHVNYVEAAPATLSFQNLTNAQIVELHTDATITLLGDAGTNVQLKPADYTEGTVVITGENAGFSTIAVTKVDETEWCIDANGALQYTVAIITGDTPRYFASLYAALAAAEAEDTIELLVDTTLTEAITVDKAITIVNTSGKDITISRGSLEADMFTVTDGGSLTLGTNNADETGKLIIDGASEAAIAYRTVTVNSGASFTLGKNATLQNANSTVSGAAIQTASANTYVYGTICNNTLTVTTDGGAGMQILAGAAVEIDGAIFSGNKCLKSGSYAGAGAALLIAADSQVTCQNATFENNTVPSNKNGGAIYVAGTFTDTNSTYTGNQAKNGGAIFLSASTAKVELTGTDATALFSGNTATGATDSRGGAIFVNGGELTVNGYTFEDNTSTGTKANTGEGAIHIANGSATVENAVFQGTSAQKIYANKNTKLTFQNLTNAQIVEMDATATITLSGNAGTNVQLKPASYTVGEVVIAGTGVDFSTIAVTTEDETEWCIDANGALQYTVAIITGDTPRYFASLNAAVAAAEAGDTIELLVSVTLTEAITVDKAITIVNTSGEEITISRGSLEADMFTVSEGGSLTLGTNDADETGALILDGTSASAIAGRTVTVNSGASFTLGSNATLQNANSTSVGAAIQTASVDTVIYGTICNNTSQDNCGGLYVLATGEATISGATFNGNKSTGDTGAALLIEKGATVRCENATFSGNDTATADKNGGAVYCAGAFEDKGSTYTGNKARNGGAIFIPAGGVVTLTANGTVKTTFTDNAANVNGGAIYVNGGKLNISGCTFTGNTTCLKDATKTINTIHKASGTINNSGDVTIDGEAYTN